MLTVNHAKPIPVHFQCEDHGRSLFFRNVWKKPPVLALKQGELSFQTDISQWDLATLKKDQFMQLNPQFFKHTGQTIPPWGRD